MFIAILFGALNSIVLRIFKNRTFKTSGDVFFFNGGVSLIWIGVMAIWYGIGKGGFSIGAVAYVAVYAVIICMFLHFKTQALATGPVALTTLISSAAFIIPTLFGLAVFKETIYPTQIAGMLLIALSLFMCINPQKSNQPLNTKWFVYCLAFFAVGGILGIFYKLFGASPYAGQVNAMMLSASFISVLLFFGCGLCINKVKKEPIPTLNKSAWLYVILSGIVGCIYIRLNISLSAVIPSVLFFPVSNGALVFLSTIAGYALFKEKLSRIQILGLVLGVVAIFITGCKNQVLEML